MDSFFYHLLSSIPRRKISEIPTEKFHTKALVKRCMIVDDSLTHVTIMNYHALRGQTGKTLIDSHEKFEQVQI